MALGQLIDYGRFADAEHRAVLLPTEPRPDLLALLKSADTGVYYRTGKNQVSLHWLQGRSNQRGSQRCDWYSIKLKLIHRSGIRVRLALPRPSSWYSFATRAPYRGWLRLSPPN